jgi:2-succinyl-5-enolpyruvyl-6-hydroxy-3-cyclohexene-1-carboxylate synthase
LIVCGPGRFNAGFAQALRRCAERQGLPVLADPLSGLRFGPESGPMVSGYDALLRNPHIAAELRPDWLLRFGHAPVSKRLGQWLEAIPTILVDPAGGWSDPNHDVMQRLCVDPETLLEILADAETSQTRPGAIAGSPSIGKSRPSPIGFWPMRTGARVT